MVRWEPGARERLQAAALELFATRGFEQTTAAEIAQSVGLTERTFFRHFSDKREVLFYGQQQFLQAFVDGVDAAPPDASPLEVIASALHAAASFFPDERRAYSRLRQSVIDQNPALRERELHKLAGLATTVAEALHGRGIGEPAATLAAQSGATVFGIAFAQWISAGERRSLSDIASDVLHELLNLTGAAAGVTEILVTPESASASSPSPGGLVWKRAGWAPAHQARLLPGGPMPARRPRPRSRHGWRAGRAIGTATAALAIVVPLASSAAAATSGSSGPARASTSALRTGCSAGARTLSPPGTHVYPETGNGGYTSVHTDVRLVYDATTNMFLSGNQVVLTDTATQCLSSFSLDFERTSANQAAGPDLSVSSVLVNGQRAAFTFAQPTYPGDPEGLNDPNPLAHEASQDNPVGGPGHNPLPPACAPELPNTSVGANSMNGTQCPANKLVITPAEAIRTGASFAVTVAYTGRPGVHNDGDGTTEGWFRSDVPSGDGGFVTTEPVGTEDWMPLNDFPTAKPSYDFYDTVTNGRTVLANGELESQTANPPSAEFPGGSTSFHWHSPEGVASYLVEDSIGRFDLNTKVVNGIRFYQAQASSLSAAQKAANLKIMNLQPDIIAFEAQFNGPYPFPSGGVVVGRPAASFEEEMQTMITFAGGTIDTDTLYHENMHQWWGDRVTEGGYPMTFYKEGLATLAEYLYHARTAETKAGGPGTQAGQAAFQASLVAQFNRLYGRTASFWTLAPSNPTPYSLFDTPETYSRPGAAYLALRQILGGRNFDAALQAIQRHYGGGSITEPQLEAAFAAWLPNRSAACQSRLGQFFQQWFDTAYPPGGGVNRPQLTGPGLAGPGFYGGTCPP